jgi:hypothetical protein
MRKTACNNDHTVIPFNYQAGDPPSPQCVLQACILTTSSPAGGLAHISFPDSSRTPPLAADALSQGQHRWQGRIGEGPCRQTGRCTLAGK